MKNEYEDDGTLRQVDISEAPEPGDYDVSEFVFAYREKDGNYYPAMVRERYDDNTMQLLYLIGEIRRVGDDEIISFMDGVNYMKLQSNWEKGGIYYSCRMESMENDRVTVVYDLDGVVEEVEINQLRLKGKKKGGGLLSLFKK